MTKYKSSIMTVADPDDHDCPTCRFLQGDHSTETLLKVIENLDHMLDNQEEYSNNLLNILRKKQDDIEAMKGVISASTN